MLSINFVIRSDSNQLPGQSLQLRNRLCVDSAQRLQQFGILLPRWKWLFGCD